MWINAGETDAGVKIGKGHVVHERCFADTGLAEKQGVFPPHRFEDRGRLPIFFPYTEVNVHERQRLGDLFIIYLVSVRAAGENGRSVNMGLRRVRPSRSCLSPMF